MKVSEYLQRLEEEIDKEGMPYFEESDLLKRLVTATYCFLEDNTKFIQTNQKAKEDLSMLTFPYSITPDVDNPDVFLFNSNFYRLVSLTGEFNSLNKGIPIVQSNDLQKLIEDPFHTPTPEQPLAEFYQNSVKVLPVPTKINGYYLRKPTFGSAPDDELITELPLHIQLFILAKVVVHLMTTIGDPRIQMQYYQVQNKGTVS
jgi:hypothetical protein